jgi:hypothetical protein
MSEKDSDSGSAPAGKSKREKEPKKTITTKPAKVKFVPPKKVHSLIFPDQRIFLEAILLDGKPAFLHRDGITGRLDFVTNFVHNDITYAPAEPLGYHPYEFKSDDDINKSIKLENLVNETLTEWRTFIACEDEWRIVNVAYDVVSYILPKLMTVPYLAGFGDIETGKGQRMQCHGYIAYRANTGTLATPANVFAYANDVKGLLIQDEFDAIERDRQLHALYKDGYKRGASVLRTSINRDGERIQHAYDTFCCKIIYSNFIVRSPAILRRTIVEYTAKRQPALDEFKFEDLKRLAFIGKRFLIWKLQTALDPLPDLTDIPFTAGAKEIYKPLLQAVYDTSIYEPLLKFCQEINKEKIEAMKTSLTALVTKACVKLRERQCPFGELRALLADYMEGEIAEKSNVAIGVRSSEYGLITDIKIVNEIKLNLGGVKARPYVHDEITDTLRDAGKSEDRQVKGWYVNPKRLLEMVEKYHLEGDTGIEAELLQLRYEIRMSGSAGSTGSTGSTG